MYFVESNGYVWKYRNEYSSASEHGLSTIGMLALLAYETQKSNSAMNLLIVLACNCVGI